MIPGGTADLTRLANRRDPAPAPDLERRKTTRPPTNATRADLYQLADYYAWAARRRYGPTGNDPRTGEPWTDWRQLDRAIGRAMNTAAARVCYAAARTYPNPLP